MRLGSYLTAVVLAASLSGVASAESAGVHLSIGLNALEPESMSEAHILSSRVDKLELGLHFLPDFLRREPTRPRDPLADYQSSSAEPEWRRLRIISIERVALRLDAGFNAPPAHLVNVDEATRQIESLDMFGLTGVLPLLEPVRVLSGVLAAQANRFVARGMSVEVGDRVDSRYTPLKGLAGDIQRGQYLRADDVTGRQFNFDVRLVLAWRPNDTIRFEAGYAVAYLSGDRSTDFGQVDRASNYLIHGPCAALNLAF